MKETKRLIVCCDGTWDDLDRVNPTNVVRLAQAIIPVGADGKPQVVYYDDGVGTGGMVDKYVGGAFGEGIDKKIQEAYRFLVLNYDPADEIFLFGFSRGAYTVRSLAGMIAECGLVSRENIADIPEAYRLYRKHTRKKADRGNERKRFFDRTLGSVPIDVLGCWDTVGALGIPDKLPWLPLDTWVNRQYRFHDTKLGSHVRLGLHAVAIDERRKEFQVTHMNPSKSPAKNQAVQEVWFSGDHACIGGGVASKVGLSNITLKWMVEEIGKKGFNLDVDWNRIRGGLPTDFRIYFDRSINWMYGSKRRTVDANKVQLHASVSERLYACPWDRPRNLRNLGTAEGGAQGAGNRGRQPRALKPGESAEFVVFSNVGPQGSHESRSRRGRNRSGIRLERGVRYKFKVGEAQVWKDGPLRPCGPNGWTLDSIQQFAREEDLGWFKEHFVRAAEKRRLVPKAAWFELVGGILGSGTKWFRIGDGSHFSNGLEAPADGELIAYANDLPARWDWVDKYDNNEGWLWVTVTRCD